jgi:ABC-2 type transport system ATP-binding protein
MRGMCIVLTTHLMEDAQRLSDYVYIIDGGRNIAEGTVAELTASATSAAESRSLEFTAAPGLELPHFPDGLVVAEDSPGHYRSSGISSPAALAALARWWSDADVLPMAISMEPKSLEDVFLELAEGGNRG